MKKLQKCPWILLSVIFSFSQMVHAQMYGTGMQMGMMGCPYEQAIGDDAESKIDEINESKEELAELRSKITEEKSKKREIEGKYKRAKEALAKRAFKENYLNFIFAHVDNIKSCDEYDLPPRKLEQATPPPANPAQPQRQEAPAGTVTDNKEVNSSRMPAAEDVKATTATPTITASGNGKPKPEPFKVPDWDRVCDRTQSGKVVANEACQVKDAQIEKLFQSEICVSKLNELVSEKQKLKDSENKLAKMEADAEMLKAKIADLKGEVRTAIREYQREQRREATESGVSDIYGSGTATYRSSKADIGGVVQNTVLGLGSIMLGNQLQKYVSNQNARIGYPTQTYPSFGFGFPFIMGAISAGMGGGRGYYGSVNGGMGLGGFGCAGANAGIGGAFGYPGGFYQTPYGGGLFSGYPMGAMLGGMGGMMMGYPMGMMAGGMGGAMMGYPMGGMMMGYPMGMMAGGMGGAMMGYPMGGMMMGYPMGMMAGGMGGAMMGYPMGMMAGGMGGAMMGYPMGMMAGGMGGAMMGYPMGMMAGGMGGAMMGYPMGMMAGGMAGMGYDSSGLMNMQLQMQQQQMQLYSQQQARAQENYMNGTRVVVGLQQEMQSVQMRLQQAVMSLNSGGYLGFSGSAGLSLGTSVGVPGTPIGSPTSVVPSTTGTTGTTGVPSSR